MSGARPDCTPEAEPCSRVQVDEMTEEGGFEEKMVAVDGEPRSVSTEPRPEPPARMSMRRRAAIFVLLLGGVLAVRPLIEATPEERRFLVTIDGPCDRILLVWRDEQGEVIRQLEQSVLGSGPTAVERVLRLRSGRYQLEMTTESGRGRASATRTIDIAEETSEVRVAAPMPERERVPQ